MGKDLEGNGFGLLQLLSRHLCEGTEKTAKKTSVKITDVATGIRTEYLSNVNQQRYCFARLLGFEPAERCFTVRVDLWQLLRISCNGDVAVGITKLRCERRDRHVLNDLFFLHSPSDPNGVSTSIFASQLFSGLTSVGCASTSPHASGSTRYTRDDE
jgi:hypothetical protein